MAPRRGRKQSQPVEGAPEDLAQSGPREGEEAEPAGRGLPRAWAEPAGTPGREDAGNPSFTALVVRRESV